MIPLEEISKRLVDAILADNILDREKLPAKVHSVLRIWHRAQERPVDYDKTRNANLKTDMGKLKKVLDKTDFERLFWQRKCRELVGEEKIQDIYKELDNLLILCNYDFK